MQSIISCNRVLFIILFILVVQMQYECTALWGNPNPDRVKLTTVNSITFYKGRMTTARRSYPVPQVKCVGGNAGCRVSVEVVQCYNQGTNGFDVQWACKAIMDSAYRFGRSDVNCEGYDYPNDPYILRGSCGVQYTLYLRKEHHMTSWEAVNTLIVIFVILLILILVVSIFSSRIDSGPVSPVHYSSHHHYR